MDAFHASAPEKLVSLGTMAAGPRPRDQQSGVGGRAPPPSTHCRRAPTRSVAAADRPGRCGAHARTTSGARRTAARPRSVGGAGRPARAPPIARRRSVRGSTNAGVADAWQLAATLASVGVEAGVGAIEWRRVLDEAGPLETGARVARGGALASAALLAEIREAKRPNLRAGSARCARTRRSIGHRCSASTSRKGHREHTRVARAQAPRRPSRSNATSRTTHRRSTATQASSIQVWTKPDRQRNRRDEPEGRDAWASRRTSTVTVSSSRVADTGAGMPGGGTGARAFDGVLHDQGRRQGQPDLGLDISRRIVVESHHGRKSRSNRSPATPCSGFVSPWRA